MGMHQPKPAIKASVAKPTLISGGEAATDDKLSARAKHQEAAIKERIARLEALLLFEGDLRGAQTIRELAFCIANDSRKVLPTRQVYILKTHRSAKARVEIDIVSNLSNIDRNAPTVRWLEKVFSSALAQTTDQPFAFQIPIGEGVDATGIPFKNGVLVPLLDRQNRLFSAVVFTSETPFTDGDLAVVARLQHAFQHAWLALAPKPRGRISSKLKRSLGVLSVVGIIGALFIPVPITSLAPLEVVAQSAQVVASPLDGVIDIMLVEPNTKVRKDQALFRFVNTELASRHSIAKRSLAVAEAKLQTARQNAFGTGNGRRNLAIAKAEQALAETELVYAAQQLTKTIVLAPVSGLVVFDRKTDWQGRPVSIGERVVEIADPLRVEYRVDLPVSDAIVLGKKARVKVFLDTAPLDPREAVLRSASYRATLSPEEQLVYKTFAVAASNTEAPPRIGARGTGQIFGKQVSLGFYLFRRPLSAIRQYTGW